MSDSENAEVLDAVFATIQDRWGEYKDGVKSDSRTVALFKKGVPKIAQKLGEEATEAVIEAVQGNKRMLVEESADMLYFLLVLWRATGVKPTKVWNEMAQRHGLPEPEERARRKSSALAEKSK